MPLPLLFIGIAAVTGTVGVGSTVKASIDTKNTKKINLDANEIVSAATDRINAQRLACGNSLSSLGEEKMFVLNSNIALFLDVFTKIKNVDFKDTEGLEELNKFHIDEKEFVELKTMVNFAGSLAGGAVAGTAIATLSGAAATNATLAFFGGGSLAAGGLGMAGGTAVLGGLVAGPALMVMGLVAGHTAKKGLDKAYTNRAEAIQIASQLETASLQCETIRRRTYMFYNLLARLDSYFLPQIYKMEDILKNEGDDYRKYCLDSKKTIASCASIAVSIKTILDIPILTDDGLLTDDSEKTATNIEGFLQNMQIHI